MTGCLMCFCSELNAGRAAAGRRHGLCGFCAGFDAFTVTRCGNDLGGYFGWGIIPAGTGSVCIFIVSLFLSSSAALLSRFLFAACF